MQMQGMYQQAAQISQVPFGINQNLPKNDEELAEYMDEYKDVYGIFAQEIINSFLDDELYLYRRAKLKLDYLVSNFAHVKLYTEGKKVRIRRINPCNAMPDMNAEDDFLSDECAFIECRYVTVPDLLMEFPHVSESEVKAMVNDYKEGKHAYRGSFLKKSSSGMNCIFEPFMDYERWDSCKVLVIEGEWVDIEHVHKKMVTDKEDRLHLNRGFGFRKEKKGEDVVNKKMKVTRKCTLLAGTEVIDWGLVEDIYRKVDDPSVTTTRYVSVTHLMNDGQTSGIIDRAKDFQDFKNYVLTRMQLEITRRFGTVVEIDKSNIDTDTYGTGKEAFEKIALHAKAHGVVIKNSSEGNPYPGGGNTGDALRIKTEGDSRFIKEALEVALWCDREIEKVTGINEARQGTVGNRELVGTTQVKLRQSNMTTATLTLMFDGFEKLIFEKLIYMTMKLWNEHPEHYEIIAATHNIKLPEDFKADMQLYKVDVVPNPISLEELLNVMQQAIASGNSGLTFEDYLSIRETASHNLKLAIYNYKKASKRRRAERMKELELQRQIQQEGIAGKAQADTQVEIAKIDRKGEWDTRIKQIEGQVQIEKTDRVTQQLDRKAKNERAGQWERENFKNKREQ